MLLFFHLTNPIGNKKLLYFMKKSITKRIKFSRTGKVIRRKMGIGHNGTRATKTQKTHSRRNAKVFKTDAKAIKTALNRVN